LKLERERERERERKSRRQFENESNCRMADVKNLKHMKRIGDTKVPISTLNQGKQVAGIDGRKQEKRERDGWRARSR